MKKILSAFLMLMIAFTVNAQLVVGLQGGYYNVKSNNDVNKDYVTTTNWLAGGQIGYQITSKIYFGVQGGYINLDKDSLIEHDWVRIDERYHTTFVDMDTMVDNHQFRSHRTGWTVSPTLRFEMFKYGNMHFNLMVQGTITSLGYTTYNEQCNKPFQNDELIDMDEVVDNISSFSWGVSLRPTLTYEFSKHLSAELSLDFLSIGYLNATTKYDNGGSLKKDEAYTETTTTMYAGLNTLMNTLSWESPLLRLGFNYTF